MLVLLLLLLANAVTIYSRPQQPQQTQPQQQHTDEDGIKDAGGMLLAELLPRKSSYVRCLRTCTSELFEMALRFYPDYPRAFI